ncbi:response regulator with CheY-like receiver domain and winged-helix DNA-binding domain [Desulfitobacterium dichloroeliminans LMG P-21439]|uniref:Stage 0 sporulation protein A homolog n=1 Tax=Desulfitobacterium dichloroeliminans (strain LMG P-21439 / DCA1) TaxID=871963 RepID=L0F8B5_DESDL|nr:response regulator transcription factor [Desulfitobacterium dichloroeliminans]AGA70044.1 response regulator with CheY-like receiver domain and winged-helix DNA-binding domain [Desulfitobacterium dichloroeliminans LMG P-21439]
MNPILVIDDEDRIRHLVRMYLEREGYSVDEADNGREALEKIQKKEYALLIIDLMMPEVDGWKVCRDVREKSDIPIIMLTARGEEFDRVLGFELGADDYLVKPFSTKELVARVKALLRRSGGNLTANSSDLAYGPLKIEKDKHRVSVDEEQITFTPREFELLYFLAKNPSRVFSREQLMETVWGYDFYGDARTVDTHVKKIREKLADPKIRSMLATVWGVGYKFDPEAING